MNKKPNFTDYYFGQLCMIVKAKDTTFDKKTGAKYKEKNFKRNLKILQALIIVVGILPIFIIGIKSDLLIYSLIFITIFYFVLPLRYYFIKFEKVEDHTTK